GIRDLVGLEFSVCSSDLNARLNKDGRGGATSVMRPAVAAPADKKKILLIDDSEITLAMEKAVLEARGYDVKATSTLVEFEKTLQDRKSTRLNSSHDQISY